MAVRMLFGCEHCAARPDSDTQRTLQGQLLEPTRGAYLDAQPGGWLIWTAGGALGRRRYACPDHRDDLIAALRHHYGSLHRGVFDVEPYRTLWPDGFSDLDELELEQLLATKPAASPRGDQSGSRSGRPRPRVEERG